MQNEHEQKKEEKRKNGKKKEKPKKGERNDRKKEKTGMVCTYDYDPADDR